MSTFQTWFNKIVSYLENNATPFRRYVFLFFAILCVRLGLEFFSNNRLFRLEDILHIGLWFMFIVSAFLVQLHLFSGESITKVFKVVVVCFSIALSAPIIDLIVSNGMGVKMNYLSINSINDIVFSYFTIGGASLNRGATMGIRIEIIILLIASFNYIYSKTRRILKSVVATLCIYTVLFFSGTLPYLISKLVEGLNLEFELEDHSSILVLVLLNLLTVSSIIYIKYTISIKHILKKIDLLSALVATILVASGSLSALKNYPDNWQLSPSNLFCIPLLLILFILFLMYHTYLKAKDSSLPKIHYYLENALFLFIACISFAISSSVFFLCLVLWAILFLMYELPLQLYKVKFLNYLLIGALTVSILLVGFVFFKAPMVGFPKKLLALVIWVVFNSEFVLNYMFIQKKWRYIVTSVFILFTGIYCYYNFAHNFSIWFCVALLLHGIVLVMLNNQYAKLQRIGYLVLSVLVLYYLRNTFTA